MKKLNKSITQFISNHKKKSKNKIDRNYSDDIKQKRKKNKKRR